MHREEISSTTSHCNIAISDETRQYSAGEVVEGYIRPPLLPRSPLTKQPTKSLWKSVDTSQAQIRIQIFTPYVMLPLM